MPGSCHTSRLCFIEPKSTVNMMETTFYEHTGRPVAYTQDGKHIFLFTGEPVAYLHGTSVYVYSGLHLGWFENGWMRDHYGACVFFTAGATGSGPVKPVKHVRPVKSVKHIKPVKGAKHARPAKAAKSLSWSAISGRQFFYQS